MRRLTLAILLSCLLLNLAACGSLRTGASPQSQAMIEITRAAVRSFAYVKLQEHGMSDKEAASAIAALQQIVETHLKGGNAWLVMDQVLWAPIRAGLVADLTKAIGGLRTNDVALFDPVSAQFLAEQFVVMIENALQRIAA